MVDKKELLDRLYKNTSSVSCYTSLEPLFKEAKKFDKTLKRNEVREYLATQHTYTLHRKTLKRFKRLPTFASGMHTNWQADLAVLNNISQFNDNFSYILVCIDVFSRQLFVAPAFTKKSQDIIVAFKKIFKKSIYVPWILCTDAGKEFTANPVQEYFKEMGIQHYSLYTSTEFHAGMVERVIRTLKERLYRYFTQNSTKRWIDVIEKINNAINNSYNRGIKTTPNSINFSNANNLISNIITKLNKAPFKVGDTVRVGKFKHSFETGYLPNYSDKIFKISKVRLSFPPTYKINDDRGKELKGWCYGSELSPVIITDSTTYRIDKILKQKKVRGKVFYFLQWTGYDDSYNSWISEHDVV